MSRAYTLAQYLDAQNAGEWAASSGWSLSVSREPARPDTTITLYDTGGGPPLTDGLDVFEPTIQVRVRSYDYLQAFSKHEEIRDLFHNDDLAPFQGVTMTSDIISIGRDDNDRFLLTANYQILDSE